MLYFNEYPLTLINLPRSTVLFNILSMCSLKDLYNLRCLSKDFILLVDFYLYRWKNLRLTTSLVENKDAFNVLTTNCYCLRLLDLSYCDNVDKHESVFLLLLRNNAEHLFEINFTNCKKISSKCMQYIFVHCKFLDTLILAGCDWFTTGALDSLTFHQSKLQIADFSNCANLSEQSILRFTAKFRHLQYLSVAHINSVTEKVYTALKYHCPELKYLVISSTQFAPNAFIGFPDCRPYLKVLF